METSDGSDGTDLLVHGTELINLTIDNVHATRRKLICFAIGLRWTHVMKQRALPDEIRYTDTYRSVTHFSGDKRGTGPLASPRMNCEDW